MNFFELLSSVSNIVTERNSKVHLAVWNGTEEPLDVYVRGSFDQWQLWQKQRNFQRDYVIGFARFPNTSQWLFTGCYRRHGEPQQESGGHLYNLEFLDEYCLFAGRVVVHFKKSFRQSYPCGETFASATVASILEDPYEGVRTGGNFKRAAAKVELATDPTWLTLPETERQALINARIGQGGYRKKLLRLWEGKCALTGASVEQALIASHIKSWHKSSHEERLDKFNGLLLAANVDRLFDQGLVSFSNDGSLLLGRSLKASDLDELGIPAGTKLRFFCDQHKYYMAFHRQEHGFVNSLS